MKKILNMLISLFLSLLTVLIFNKFLKLNIFYLVVYFILFLFINYKYLFKSVSKRTNIFSCIFSLLFSFLQVVSYNCSNYNEFDVSNVNNIKIYFYIIILAICFYSTSKLLFNMKNEKKFFKSFNWMDKIFNKKYSFFIVLLLIILAWIPVFIDFYPGNYAYDAYTQMEMFNNTLVFTMYQPVIHTAFLGSMIRIGEVLFKSYKIGLMLYSIIQMLIMASIFSYIITYLYKKLPNYLSLLFLLLFMFLPTHTVMAITTTKDVIFSGAFALLFIKLIALSENPDEFFKCKKNWIITILLLFILFIFRNNMIFAFVLFFPILCVFLKKYLKKLLLIFLISIELYFNYNVFLLKKVNIKKIDKAELLSVPMQQLAATYNYGKLSSSDKSEIEKLFKSNIKNDYNPIISDSIKINFIYFNFSDNKKEYINLYTKLGTQNINIYIDSWFNLVYSYFYIYDKLPYDWYKTYLEVNTIGTEYTKSREYKDDAYKRLVDKAEYQNIPILNVFMNLSVYVWIMIFTILVILKSKKYKLLIPVLLLFIYFLTLLLGPVSLMRYVYPMFVSFPLMIYLIKKAND